MNVSDLPCQGCKYCQRIHEQWARFEDDVDDVVPLAVRCIQSDSETTSDNIQSIEAGRLHTPMPEVTVVNWLQSVGSKELASLQKADPVLSTLHTWKASGTLPTNHQVLLESPAVRKFWLCWSQVRLRQGVLYYSWEKVGAQHPTLLLLIPVSMQREILQACHNPLHSGHLGEAKTLERLCQSYHWHGMSEDVRLFIKTCQLCNACKSRGVAKRAKLQSYQAGAPLDRVHLDILGPFPVSSSGNKYILVIIDQFT